MAANRPGSSDDSNARNRGWHLQLLLGDTAKDRQFEMAVDSKLPPRSFVRSGACPHHWVAEREGAFIEPYVFGLYGLDAGIMMDAAHRVLDQLDLGEHRASALVYYHPADFVYIVVDRVHPESGYITPVNDDPHKLGVWLSNYEQEHEPSSAATQVRALREHERPQSVGELQSMLAEPETSAARKAGAPSDPPGGDGCC